MAPDDGYAPPTTDSESVAFLITPIGNKLSQSEHPSPPEVWRHIRIAALYSGALSHQEMDYPSVTECVLRKLVLP